MNKYDEGVSTCNELIYGVIRKYFRGYDIEDLYQVGVVGVMKAFDNYKNDKNTKFTTYAYKYIYGEIYTYLNSSKLVKTSRDTASLYRKINEAKNILSQRLMKEPTVYELAAFLEMEPNIIQMAINSVSSVDSIDRVIYSDGRDVQMLDTIRDDKDYYNIDYMLLHDEINKLPEEEKQIIYLRYFEDRTQREVADILGKSQVGVSRVENKTLKKMRVNYQNVA